MDDTALAEFSLMRLQRRYADIATRMAWSEVPSLATPDASFTFDLRIGAPIELNGPEELAHFGAAACARFDFYNYTPLNSVVTLTDGVEATGRAYSLEIGHDQASEAWIEFYGLYHDRYVIQDGDWRFIRRHFQTVASRRDGVTTTYEPFDPDSTG